MRSRFLCAAVAALTLSACSSSPSVPSADIKAASPIANSDVPALDRAGWTESVYQKLTETIRGSAGQGKIVVFDFDNTTQARDIGEAVLARVQQTDAIYLGILGAARRGLADGSLVELALDPLFSGEARLALVTLAGRTELPIMAVFRAFVSSRLGD